MDEHPPDSLLRRAARWLQATPLELAGLAILLTGAIVASAALWWSATQRPSDLPAGVFEVGAPDTGSGVDGGHDAASGGEGGGGEGGAEDGSAVEGSEAAHDDAAAASDLAELTIHVTGAVAAPGVVVVPGGARVGDAVAAAGGMSAESDPELVNLARPLTDGEHVHVPREGEAPASTDPATGDAATTPDGRIDINRATAEQLEELPGIGPARAEAIVGHREANGPFAVPGDLRAVPGIGEATFQRLAELVTAG